MHRRWIQGEPFDGEAILDAPEMMPVADATAMCGAVPKMRRIPISMASISMASISKLVVALAMPILLVAALQIPVTDLLFKLLKLLKLLDELGQKQPVSRG